MIPHYTFYLYVEHLRIYVGISEEQVTRLTSDSRIKILETVVRRERLTRRADGLALEVVHSYLHCCEVRPACGAVASGGPSVRGGEAAPEALAMALKGAPLGNESLQQGEPLQRVYPGPDHEPSCTCYSCAGKSASQPSEKIS